MAIAVFGIDDIEQGRYSRPTLSSVSLDVPHIAQTAINRLVRRIDEPDLTPIEDMAAHRLIARESTTGTHPR